MQFVPSTLLCGLVALTAASSTLAQTPTLLRDIETSGAHEGWSFPCWFASAGQKLVFRASDRTHGEEVWVSDGTAAGTQNLVDLQPGPAHGHVREITSLGTLVLFQANPTQGTPELWVTDGTPAGTQKLGSFPDLGSAATLGGRYFFAASDPQHGTELWVSDGTPQGTQRFLDIAPGAASSSPCAFAAFGAQLLFFATTPQHGCEPWITDGTPQGTRLFADLVPGPDWGGDRNTVTLTDGTRCFFVRSNGLWKAMHTLAVSDGTPAGTRQLGAALTDLSTQSYGAPALVQGRLLFTAAHRIHGLGLWASDGTLAGTGWVLDFDPASQSPGWGEQAWEYQGAFWAVIDTTAEGAEIWRSDGTSLGTGPVLRLQPGPVGFQADYLGQFGGRFFFAGNHLAQKRTLYASDGTMTGTIALQELEIPLWYLPTDYKGTALTVHGSRAVLAANDGVHGFEPWITDGTAQGTRLLANVCGPESPEGSIPSPFVTFGTRSFFTAADQSHGREFWVTDGTEAGTQRLADLAPGKGDGARSDWMPAGDTLFAAGDDDLRGAELWTYRPFQGLRFVADLRPGSAGSQPQPLGAFGTHCVFSADDGVHGRELWISDGSLQSTVLLGDLKPGSAGSTFSARIVVLGDAFYFLANGSLYRSDGSPQGTAPVRLPAAITGVQWIWRFQAQLLLGVTTTAQTELWTSDGTQNGTQPLSPAGANVDLQDEELVAIGADFLAFIATTATTGRELWWSDGTPAGTRVLDLNAGSASSQLGALAPFGARIVFTNADHRGHEPWISDGTLAGTQCLGDLQPGVQGSRPYGYAAAGSRHLYFFGWPASSSATFYRTDGTPQGTQPLLSMNLRPNEPMPLVLGHVAGRLVLRCADPDFGLEPFVLDDGAMSWPLGTPCGPIWIDLVASDAVLGGTAHYDARSRDPLQPLVLILGAPASWPQTWFSLDCVAHFDPATMFAVDGFVGPTRRSLVVPNVPALAGLRIVPQLFTISGSTPVLSSSRAWLQRVGH